MPKPENPGTSQYRCAACGRRFNTVEELRAHQADCLGAKSTGSGEREVRPDSREEGEDREWVSTP